MSDAYEALMNLPENEVAGYAADSAEEGHIVIGKDRFITVPSSLKRIAVQYDHSIETVTFDCPRYWDDHDLSQMIIYINFKAANGVEGSYMATNISAAGDIMHFDWVIERDVTQMYGQIAFLVCIKRSDSNGNEINHWNSELCTDMHVSEGLEVELTLSEEYPAIMTQLLERMTAVEQINVQAEEMRTLHDETIEAQEVALGAMEKAMMYQTSIEAKDKSIRNSYANAIKYKTSGEVIRVDDVSPIEHDVKTVVRSRNLAVRSRTDTEIVADGITFTVNADGSITANGTATSTAYFLMQIGTGYSSQIPIKKGRYTIGLAPAQGCRVSLGLRPYESSERILYYSTFTNTISFDVTTDTSKFDIILCVDSGYTVTDAVFKPLLVEGDTADEYAPYVDPSTATVTRCGKNVFELAGKTQTLNGVTCTVNADGTVVVDGTAEKATFFGLGNVYPVVGAKYRLSGCPSGGDFDTYILYIHNNTTGADIYDLGSGKTFTGSAGDQGLTIAVYAGMTVSNLTFQPMVILGEEAEDFESYTGATYTPASDGSVEATSLSPTMVMYADTPGVIIDIEYNRDLNVIFDEINTLLELLLNGGA